MTPDSSTYPRLRGLSDDAIMRCASMWLLCVERSAAGDEPPPGVFLIDLTSEVTDDDVRRAQVLQAKLDAKAD